MWILALLMWRIHWYSSHDFYLYQSIHLSVLALSSDNRGGGGGGGRALWLLEWWCWYAYLGRAKLFGVLPRLKLRGTKSATCALKFGTGLISWGLIFLVCHGPRHFYSFFFGTAQPIISWVDPLGSDDEEILKSWTACMVCCDFVICQSEPISLLVAVT